MHYDTVRLDTHHHLIYFIEGESVDFKSDVGSTIYVSILPVEIKCHHLSMRLSSDSEGENREREHRFVGKVDLQLLPRIDVSPQNLHNKDQLKTDTHDALGCPHRELPGAGIAEITPNAATQTLRVVLLQQLVACVPIDGLNEAVAPPSPTPPMRRKAHTSSLDFPKVMFELNLCFVDSAMLVP
jgi:hypothetical protein